MSEEQIAELEQRLMTACREAEARGMTISPDISHENSCCPLGALCGAKPGDSVNARFAVHSEFNGLGFWPAFDFGAQSGGRGLPLFELGLKFRAIALSGKKFGEVGT